MGLKYYNILSWLENKSCIYADRIALGIKDSSFWREFKYKDLNLLAKRMAVKLIEELKIKKSSKIAILSESNPEYGVCILASILCGACIIPLDIKLTEYELISIFNDAKPDLIMVSKKYYDIALKLKNKISSLKHIIIIDSYLDYKEKVIETTYNYIDIRINPNSTVFLIYTSGTTGEPKGVEISYKNIMTQLNDLEYILKEILPKNKNTIKALSILPINHLFEMTVGFLAFLSFGFSIYYPKNLTPKDIMDVMSEKHIEFMILVPAVLKLFKCSIENELKKSPLFTQYMFKILYFISQFIPSYKIKKLMFKRIHDKFGGEFIGCISGGAALDTNIGKFFERIGIKIYQGYGLTETGPVVSVNTDKRSVICSVGRPLKHYKAKTDKITGELLLKGPSVMKGYHNQPVLTSRVIDSDGWLHTGDIAKLDKDGHIYITGRIKNMIVLQGGKKIFPEEVESVLEQSSYISEVCVVGTKKAFGSKEGNEEVTAVIVPKSEMYEKYSCTEVENIVKSQVKTLSSKLCSFKRPTNIVIKKDAFEKTPSRKIKRTEVQKMFSDREKV